MLMNRVCVVALAAIGPVGVASAQVDIVTASRFLGVGSSFPFGISPFWTETVETNAVGAFDRTISYVDDPPGILFQEARASMNSAVGSEVITLDSEVFGNGGQFPSGGVIIGAIATVRLEVVFDVTLPVPFVLIGENDAMGTDYSTSQGFSLSFDGGATIASRFWNGSAGSEGPFSFSGMLAPGRYRFLAFSSVNSAGGGDIFNPMFPISPNLATLTATLVVPAPGAVAVLGVGGIMLNRRRRTR